MHWSGIEDLFWFSAALVAYAYVLYPIGIAVVARFFRPPPLRATQAPSISVVIAAFNEETDVERRIREFLHAFDTEGLAGEVVMVSDGSTDSTVTCARNVDDLRITVLELAQNEGKAAAISCGCAAARGDIIVFADTRQYWSSRALSRLVAPLADPAVGAVSGELIIESGPASLAGVGAYWRYEKWIRRNESRVHSCIGVSGSISAVRRDLFTPIPAPTILDDVYWPMQVILRGYSVKFVDTAHAFDRLPTSPTHEFRRKIRTLAGNYQLLATLPSVLSPRRNSVWLQFWSHKVMRLIVPWALIAMFVTSAVIRDVAYTKLFWLQAGAYLLGCAGIIIQGRRSHTLFAFAGNFLLLNAAAWLAFWVWLFGRAPRSWAKASYDMPDE